MIPYFWGHVNECPYERSSHESVPVRLIKSDTRVCFVVHHTIEEDIEYRTKQITDNTYRTYPNIGMENSKAFSDWDRCHWEVHCWLIDNTLRALASTGANNGAGDGNTNANIDHRMSNSKRLLSAPAYVVQLNMTIHHWQVYPCLIIDLDRDLNRYQIICSETLHRSYLCRVS